MRRSSVFGLAAACGMLGCEPELSDVPFACSAEGICPEGYTCQSTVCVLDGTSLPASRPMRITWVNAGEMYWFASASGGATLVVNEGFSQGARGLYEIVVSPEGKASEPRLILDFGEEFPTSSSVVALNDDRYGVLTLSFPSVSSSSQRVSFWSVPREGRGSPAELYAEPAVQPPFQGGSEPVYVGALARKGWIDVTYADPSAGGQVVVARIQDQKLTERHRLPLATALPLSADSLLWDLGDAIAVRVGLEESALWRISDDPTPVVEGPLVLGGQPVYAFDDRVVVLTTSERDDTEDTGNLDASLEIYDWSGAPVDAPIDSGVLQGDLEPFSGTPGASGVRLAPLSDNPDFPELGVASLEADGTVRRVADIPRPGTDGLYSARAFSRDGKVYLAWTSFHESLMDLWVAVGDEAAQ